MEKRLSLNEVTYFDIDGRFRVKLEEKVIRILGYFGKVGCYNQSFRQIGGGNSYFFMEEIIFLCESCSSFLEKITLVSMEFDNLIFLMGITLLSFGERSSYFF